ncbi:MAG: hypothetical protein HY006_00155 [Candidatus Sungbacteria bacterium]|nr:hypothetical protein [Candidatus Sungbacteria bacterium]
MFGESNRGDVTRHEDYIMEERISSKIEYESIASEIAAMVAKDQEMRKRALKNEGVIETEEDEKLDQENTIRMKEIINQIGWPTIPKVGKEIAEGAWFLVQHADHDVEFQKRCLQLMRKAPEGEVSKIEIAYLEDRVRVNEGRPQLYGTQFCGEGENYAPRPIENPKKVDERRQELGLESMEKYKESLLEKYNQ